jgi:hypothetical protein
LLVLPFPVLATTIVALVEAESITIAADSVLIGHSIDTGGPARDLVCKIRCVGRLCFAASGRYGNSTIGYDLWPLAETELRHSGSPEVVFERFKTVIAPLMPKLVDVSKKETPLRYSEWLTGKPVLAYLFAGFDPKGKPLVVSGEVMIDSEGRTLPIRESVRRGESKIGAVVLGWNQHIADFAKRNPMWTASAARDPSEFAERMVRIEIQASEDAGRHDVGEPISIVRMTYANGFSVENIGICREN